MTGLTPFVCFLCCIPCFLPFIHFPHPLVLALFLLPPPSLALLPLLLRVLLHASSAPQMWHTCVREQLQPGQVWGHGRRQAVRGSLWALPHTLLPPQSSSHGIVVAPRKISWETHWLNAALLIPPDGQGRGGKDSCRKRKLRGKTKDSAWSVLRRSCNEREG